ncbi:MAG: hypothetical protein ACTSVM_06625 [Candidatus Ranarchaeia archaeon]
MKKKDLKEELEEFKKDIKLLADESIKTIDIRVKEYQNEAEQVEKECEQLLAKQKNRR